MMKSQVYFMDDRARGAASSMPAKAQRLFDHAGLGECFGKGDSVAVKVHMGEWFNSGYLRPILVRAIVDRIKGAGGRPFVTDTTTIFYLPGIGRTTAEDYLYTAAANGFTSDSMGCPIVIADGLTGLDDVKVDIPDGIILQEAYLARGIAEADAMIAVSHFKGHALGVYGGAIKNVGIGCASKRGKFYAHLTTHPRVGLNRWEFHGEKCLGKGRCPVWVKCANLCPADAFTVQEDRLNFDPSKCVGCFAHNLMATECGTFTSPDDYWRWAVVGIADSASAFIRFLGRGKVGFINYALDMAPGCDCTPWSDRPITPNLGAFASKDMVAIDTATLDMADRAHGVPGSKAEEAGALAPNIEKFTITATKLKLSQWIQANACEHLGVGTKEYELVEPPVPSEEERFWFPKLSLDKPAGYFFRKRFKIESIIPPGGFNWNPEPRLTIEELSKR